MTKQEHIIRDLAKKHGIQLQQAEEIWKLFGAKIVNVIHTTPKKKENGEYNLESFPVIHIDNFGKFVPRTTFIQKQNKKLQHDS